MEKAASTGWSWREPQRRFRPGEMLAAASPLHLSRRPFSGTWPDGLPWRPAPARRPFGLRFVGTWPGIRLNRHQSGRGRQVEAWQAVAAAALGGVLVYFLDPVSGRRRRNMAVQRAGKILRRSGHGLGRAGRRMAADVSGKGQALGHARDTHEPLDDATLAHKVESILFRDPQVPKGRINVHAEHGVVILHGEVEQTTSMSDIERTVRHIDGVREVRSMLHTASQQRD